MMMMPLQEGRKKEKFEGVSLECSDNIKEKSLLKFIHKTSTPFILVYMRIEKEKV